MAGFDEGGVFFSDNFGSEEQTDENQINRQQVKKRFKDFIRQFHEGNFSYTYRYIFLCIFIVNGYCTDLFNIFIIYSISWQKLELLKSISVKFGKIVMNGEDSYL